MCFSLVLGASANETDNFFLPLDPEFADLGDYLELVHTRAMEQGVQEVNSRIERALNIKDAAKRARQLARWQTPEALAEAVAAQFGAAPAETLNIEGALGSPWAQQTFPHQRLMTETSPGPGATIGRSTTLAASRSVDANVCSCSAR